MFAGRIFIRLAFIVTLAAWACAGVARAWLTHSEVARGGTLVLDMGPRPSLWGGANRPPSMSKPPTR